MSIKEILFIIPIFPLLYVTAFDIKYKKIPNKITFPLMLFGIILNSYYFGFDGLKESLLGILIAFLLFMTVSTFINAVGFGDIKMLMSIGAVFGFNHCIEIFIISITSCLIVHMIKAPSKLMLAVKTSTTTLYKAVIYKEVNTDLNLQSIDYKFIYGPYIFIAFLISIFITKGNLLSFLI